MLNLKIQILIMVLTIYQIQCSVSIAHFNTSKNISFMHQVNETTILVGTNQGNMIYYTDQGKILKQNNEVHHNAIIMIEYLVQNGIVMIISIDLSGLIVIWKQDLQQILKVIDLRKQVVNSCINRCNKLLLLNFGNQIWVYELENYTLKYIIKANIQQTIIQVQSNCNTIFLLINNQDEFIRAIHIQDRSTNEYLHNVNGSITDFSISQQNTEINSMRILVIINNTNLISFQLQTQKSILIHHQNKHQPNQNQDKLHLLEPFKNNQSQSLFVLLKDSKHLIISNLLEIHLLLQLNFEIIDIKSSLNNSILLLNPYGRITILKIFNDQSGIETWIIVIAMIILLLGLYPCCKEIIPGIAKGLRENRDKQQIQMEIYQQKEDLQHF